MRISGLMEAMATDPAKKRDRQRARQAAEKAKADTAVIEARMAELSPAHR